MSDYRPFHLPGCPARDADHPVDSLRIGEAGTIVTVRFCICPPERFAPGSKPIYEPGHGPGEPG